MRPKMRCNDCNRQVFACDKCGDVLVEFACVSASVVGEAAQQLGVPDGSLLGPSNHYCHKCFESCLGCGAVDSVDECHEHPKTTPL